jgi:hypothetical protein
MWIFYKHLPRNVTLKEIRKVTLRGARLGWSPFAFFKRIHIKRAKIIRIKDLQSETIEYHALVQINPTTVTDIIIENLDGKTVNGLFLKPHRYHRRFPNRDRRILEDGRNQNEERRKTDRRRQNLITKVMDIG